MVSTMIQLSKKVMLSPFAHVSGPPVTRTKQGGYSLVTCRHGLTGLHGTDL